MYSADLMEKNTPCREFDEMDIVSSTQFYIDNAHFLFIITGSSSDHLHTHPHVRGHKFTCGH